jgi:hypothetical protein
MFNDVVTIHLLQDVDARSISAQSYRDCQVLSSVPPFNYDEVPTNFSWESA